MWELKETRAHRFRYATTFSQDNNVVGLFGEKHINYRRIIVWGYLWKERYPSWEKLEVIWSGSNGFDLAQQIGPEDSIVIELQGSFYSYGENLTLYCASGHAYFAAYADILVHLAKDCSDLEKKLDYLLKAKIYLRKASELEGGNTWLESEIFTQSDCELQRITEHLKYNHHSNSNVKDLLGRYDAQKEVEKRREAELKREEELKERQAREEERERDRVSMRAYIERQERKLEEAQWGYENETKPGPDEEYRPSYYNYELSYQARQYKDRIDHYQEKISSLESEFSEKFKL
ncbi:MAG: hypothetical protein A3F10_04015 [Coxiella sp. RIFCSPHIGHO2_12_FULL_42_15]|nr:MAG: hypothetical protein A3F10_04015 [Coxiella sp. RIFCSPHIGHO2_12_FULL_42_15]